MKYDFRVGQMVRIGNEIRSEDLNYHKRGYIIGFGDDGYPIVDMIDPFNTGATKVNWCPSRFWEPCQAKLTCKSLL